MFQDVYDRVDYLSSLGKSQTAAVKRDADIGVAQANRDAGIRVCKFLHTHMQLGFKYMYSYTGKLICCLSAS